MRETAYAKELASESISLGGYQGKIEKLIIKASGEEEIRFSMWNQEGKYIPCALNLKEEDLIRLIQKAIRAGVLSPDFISKLRDDFEI